VACGQFCLQELQRICRQATELCDSGIEVQPAWGRHWKMVGVRNNGGESRGTYYGGATRESPAAWAAFGGDMRNGVDGLWKGRFRMNDVWRDSGVSGGINWRRWICGRAPNDREMREKWEEYNFSAHWPNWTNKFKDRLVECAAKVWMGRH